MLNLILIISSLTVLTLSCVSILFVRKQANLNAIKNVSKIQQVSDSFIQLFDDWKKEMREEYAKHIKEEWQFLESIRSYQNEIANELQRRIYALEQYFLALLEREEESRQALRRFQDELAEISQTISKDKTEMHENAETLRKEINQAICLNRDSIESIRFAIEDLQKTVWNLSEEFLEIEDKIRSEKDTLDSVSLGLSQAMKKIIDLEALLQAIETIIGELRVLQENQVRDISESLSDSLNRISKTLSLFPIRLEEITEKVQEQFHVSVQAKSIQERKTDEIQTEIQAVKIAIGKMEPEIPAIVKRCIEDDLLPGIHEMNNGLTAHEVEFQARVEDLKNYLETILRQFSSFQENFVGKMDFEKARMKILTTRQRVHALASFISALRKTRPVSPVLFNEKDAQSAAEPGPERNENQIPRVGPEKEFKPEDEGLGVVASESLTSEDDEDREIAWNEEASKEIANKEVLEQETGAECCEKTRHIEPVRRGGQRLGSIREAGPSRKRNNIDIFCVKRGNLWEVVGRIPKRVLRYSPSVFENSKKVDWVRNIWEFPIASLKGVLRCDWVRQGFAETIEREFGQDDYLLFKILRQGNLAKMVSEHSTGDYICIVPSSYMLEEQISGRPIEKPEHCSIEGARVHFFHITTRSGIAFRRPDGSILKVMNSWKEFHLEGDTSKYLAGPNGESIFFSHPPAIVAEEEACWDKVGNIVIRSDREGEKREKRYLPPGTGRTRQIRIPEGMELSGGHFTILLYDRNDDLLESLPFGFHKGFRGIEIEGYEAFGDAESNRIFKMEFLHLAGFSPIPGKTGMESFFEMEAGIEKTTILLSISPECETLSWKIRPGEPDELRFQTNFPSIWWGIGKERTDLVLEKRLLEVNLKEIRPEAGFKLFVRAPSYASNLKAGFDFEGFGVFRLQKLDQSMWCLEMAEVGAPIFLNPARVAGFRIPLVLSLEDGEKVHKMPIGYYLVRKKCVFCEGEFAEYEIKAHLKEKHEDEICSKFFRELTYTEIAEADRSLPAKIYKCSFPGCPYYLKVSYEDALENPTSGILNHFEREHRGKQPSFRPVTSIVEIRENILSTLCETWRCEVCGGDFTNRVEMLKHAIAEHLDRFTADGGE